MDKFKFFKKYGLIVVLILIGIGLWARNPKEIILKGSTMGTTWNIKAYGPKLVSKSTLNFAIKQRLESLNNIFSTWKETSELSKLNESNINDPIKVSEELWIVLKEAKKIVEYSNGAYEPTLLPLIKAWGFSGKDKHDEVPTQTEIKTLINSIGYNNLQFLENRQVIKLKQIKIDLSSIAKGYAVDELVKTLKEFKIDTYMIEVGGEIKVSKETPKKSHWKIGINTPDKNSSLDDINTIVTLSSKAIATSGDYRNYFIKKGKAYSHIIDPRTGYPVDHGVSGVSVVADSCMLADGLATAVLVMGVEKGLDLINSLENIEVMITSKETNLSYKTYYSKNFKEYLN